MPRETNTFEELVDQVFKDAFVDLYQRVAGILRPKRIGGVECTGVMLALFLEQSVEKINAENFSIPSAVEATMDGICAKYAREALSLYNANMLSISQVIHTRTRTRNLLTSFFLTELDRR